MSTHDRVQAVGAIHNLFKWAYQQGRLNKLKALFTKRSRRLFELSTIRGTCRVNGYSLAERRQVCVNKIQGTESRVKDFDVDFYPLQAHDEERWKNIAALLKAGKTLPPVKLVQVENVYFVQDGHHRISIARATGQEYIDALVTTLDVGDPLPGIQRPKMYECLNNQ